MADSKAKSKNKDEEAQKTPEATEVAADISNATDSEALEASTETADDDAKSEPETLAKAGKRSAKSLKESEEKAAKEARKTEKSEDDAEVKPKKVIKPTRSRLERRGKLYRQSAEKIEPHKSYSLDQAIELARTTSHVKFDATVELHVNLGVDPRIADQNIRDTLLLPAGTGKKIRIAVLTEDAESAKSAGADIAGTDELLAQIEKGDLNFDILIATPALMSRLGKFARVLGPRGLMPSPKSGTVTTDVNRAVSESKAGKVEYRVDSTGIIHLGIGKVSFSAPQLTDNFQAVLASVKSNKPSSIKGIYLKSAHLTTSMGPSIIVDLSSIG